MHLRNMNESKTFLLYTFKGSPIIKAFTCMEIYLYKQNYGNFVKETGTSGHIVV